MTQSKKTQVSLVERLLIQFSRQNELIENISSKYGEVKVIKYNRRTFEYKMHDYYHFCLVKACKSLNSTEVLIVNFLQEDAQTILRTAFECFLNASFTRHNPNSLDNFLDFKLGLIEGAVKHPTSKKGKPLRNKIINPYTGEINSYGYTLYHMANNNGVEEDAILFQHLYKQLSEHVHVHFMTSGNYRNKEEFRYTMYETSRIFQPVYQGVLLSLMILEDVIIFSKKIEKRLLNKITTQLKKD